MARAGPHHDQRAVARPASGTAGQRCAAVRCGDAEAAATQASDLPETVALWAVDVREVDPPAGQEPVHWRLLTTHAVTTVAEARQIVAWYRMRWIIEQLFRSLKSHGLRIEDSQMEEARSFTKLAVVALIAAVCSIQLVLARDGSTGQKITDAVETADMPALQSLNASLEGRTEKLKNPHGNRGKTGGGGLGGLAAATDEVGQIWNELLAWNVETCAEVVPEGDAELRAGMRQAKECIAAVAAMVTAGAAADLALDDMATDVTLRAIGLLRSPTMQRYLRPIEHHQQLGLVGVQPLEQAIQSDEAGAAAEDAVEAGTHLATAPGGGVGPICLEVGIEPPDQRADPFLCGAMQIGEGIELVHQAFRVHPA